MSFPKAVVLDLDGTVWDPEMYQLYGGSPFSTTSTPDVIKDCSGTKVNLYSGVLTAIRETKDSRSYLCIASSTDEPMWARECLTKFFVDETFHEPISSKFDVVEIYKGSKVNHLEQIRNKTGLTYEDILFIDNEQWNIRSVSSLGVPSY